MGNLAMSLLVLGLASCATVPASSIADSIDLEAEEKGNLSPIEPEEFAYLTTCSNYWRSVVDDWIAAGGRINTDLVRNRHELANSDSRLGAIFRETWRRRSRDGAKDGSEHFMDAVAEESPECAAPFWLATILRGDDVAFPVSVHESIAGALDERGFRPEWSLENRLIYFLIEGDGSSALWND
jgi:hypothetical protein